MTTEFLFVMKLTTPHTKVWAKKRPPKPTPEDCLGATRNTAT